MPQMPVDSELEQYAREQAQAADKANRLKVSMAYAVTQNPDNYAEATKMAERLKVQPNMLVDSAMRKSMGETEAVTTFNPEDMIARNPLLSNWVENPDNAAISHDDLDNLKNIESRAATIGAAPSFMDRFKKNYDKQDTELSGIFPGARLVKTLADTIGGTDAVRNLNVNNGKTFGQVIDDAQRLSTYVNKPLDTSILQPNPNFGIATGVANLVEKYPVSSSFAGIPLPPVVSGGILKALARTTAGLTTIKNLGILFGSGELSLDAKAVMDSYFANEMIPGLLHVPQAVKDAPNAQEKIAALVEGGINAFFTYGVTKGLGGHTQFVDDLAHIIDATEQSKLKQRSPEKYQEFVTHVFDGQEDFRIPVENFDTYFQSKNIDPAQMAEAVGVKNYLEAKASGSEVQIARADFAGRLDVEHQKALLPDVVDPKDGLTLNQRTQGEEELQKWAKEGGAERLQKAFQDEVAKVAENPDYQQIRDEISKRLQEGQGMTKAVANSHAELGAMQYMNAERAGMSPLEFFKAKNPTFAQGEAPEASLNQSAVTSPEFKQWFGDSKVVDESGNPLVVYHGTDANFTEFKSGELGFHFGTSEQAGNRATRFGANLMPVYLDIKNPARLSADPAYFGRLSFLEQMVKDGIISADESNALLAKMDASDSAVVAERNRSKAKNDDGFAERQARFKIMREFIESKGYDGIVYPNEHEGKGDSWMAFHPEQVKSATGNRGTFDPNNPNILFQAAYHGSPYKFDKFSLEHLGKGEGAQAYGWGLYFAGKQSVADYYREALSEIYPNGVPTTPGTVEDRAAAFVADAVYNKSADPTKLALEIAKSASAPEEVLNQIREWRKNGTEFKKSGQLYKADIPEDSNMLLFDKRISEQPEGVQKSLEQVRETLDKAGVLDDYLERMNADWEELKGHEVYTLLKRAAMDDALGSIPSEPVNSAMERGDFSEAASKFLNDNGIKGLKYLDGSSRGRGEGSHNYVIFDDSAVKILETYYQGEKTKPRGWFSVKPDGSFEIGKTPFGDPSTPVHEALGHPSYFMLRDLSAMEGASEQLKADFKAVHEWMGVKEGEAPSREQLEKWARGVELYFTEGKAPTAGLRGVFQRVAVWMSSVYQKAKEQLGVEISPKVRDVMDRWFAATDAVEKAQAELSHPLTAEQLGFTEEQFQKYAESKGLELDKAREEIVAKFNEAAIRERSQQWKDDEKNVREAVTAQLDASPDFQAIATLRKGKMADGTPLTLNRDALVKQFGEERTKALLDQHMKIYRQKGGVDADTAAEVLGFDSGEDLMAALEGAPNRKQAIEDYTRQEMIRQHGDIRYDGTLDDQAKLAVSNETRISNLHKELRAFKKLAETAQKESKDAKAEAKVAQAIPSIQSFRDAAVAMIEGKQIVDLNPNSYLNAQRKFSREAYSLSLKGDYEGAREAKQKELINQFLFTESLKAKAEVDKVYAYVKRLGKGGAREKIAKAGGELGQQVYLDQIDNILEQFQFSNESNKSIRERQSLQGFAAVKQAEALREFLEVNPTWTTDHPGETPQIPSPVDTTMAGVSKNYRELTLPELRAVKDMLKNIEFLAKKEYGFIRDGKLVSLAGEVADFDTVARKNNETKLVPRSGTDFSTKEEALRWLHGADGFATKMEWLVNQLDGGDVNGPARRNIKKPIDDANGKWLDMGHEIYGKLGELLKARPEQDIKDIFESTGVRFPSSDRPLNRMQLISWALNLGTVENQKVALLGEGLIKGDGSVDSIYDSAIKALRPSEWRFVQGVWDILDGMAPEVKAKALRVNGVEPKMKTVTPFDVTASDGSVIHMRGGYYPLKGEYGDRVGNLQQDPAKQQAVGYSRPTTSTSHTKEVTGATYRLLLDYQNVLSQHLADVIKDTTTGEAISDVYKFINQEQVKNTIQETLGPKEEREFLMWLQDFAGSGKGQQRGNDPFLNFLMSRRSGMVVARLGANFGSYAVQLGDVFKSLADPDIKTKYLAKAFLDIRRNPSDMIEWIREQSPNEMRFREENFQREIKEMITEKSVFDQKKQVVSEFLMSGFGVIDRFVTFPAWLARYRQGMAEHGNAKQAAAEADRTIARSYQAGDNRNMSRMMRTGGYIKLLTTFGGDANTWYGLISSSVRSGNKKAIATGIMALVAEQIVGQYIKNRGMQKDDDKTTWLLLQTLNAFLGKIPVFGDVGEYAVNSAAGKYASLQNPTYQALESGGKAAKSLFSENKDTVEKAQDLTEATGIWMGIPGTSQAIRSWKYLYKVQTGEERPDNLYEAGRNTIFGKAKK